MFTQCLHTNSTFRSLYYTPEQPHRIDFIIFNLFKNKKYIFEIKKIPLPFHLMLASIIL